MRNRRFRRDPDTGLLLPDRSIVPARSPSRGILGARRGFIAGGGAATPTNVQTPSISDVAGAYFPTWGFVSNVTSGNLLVVQIWETKSGGGSDILSITSDRSPAFTRYTAASGSTAFQVSTWYATANASGAVTISLTQNSASHLYVGNFEISGAAGGIEDGIFGFNSGTGQSLALTSGGANRLLLSTCFNEGSTAGANFDGNMTVHQRINTAAYFGVAVASSARGSGAQTAEITTAYPAGTAVLLAP